MSADFERLIGRAVSDKAFRDNLLADPDGTIQKAQLQLSPDELDKLKETIKQVQQNLSSNEIDQTFGISASGFWS